MLPARQEEAFEVIPGSISSGILILCDHASNAIPAEYDRLGLPKGELQRHIAYDIGASGLARALAARLGAPAVLSRFSRLLIDPNRGTDDPTLIMRIADGAIIPGNVEIDATERQRRLRRFWQAYDDAITASIDAFLRAGRQPLLLSVHTFTPVWRGLPRPWHAGILFDPQHPSISPLLVETLRRHLPDMVIGANEPYSGGLPGDTLDRHGVHKKLAHTLVEIRQDLVADAAGQQAWAAHLADALQEMQATPGSSRTLDAAGATDAHLSATSPVGES